VFDYVLLCVYDCVVLHLCVGLLCVSFMFNKGFVKSALQYVKVHMNNFLEIYKFH
jgi:hypothetical protein